jgi:Tol biopolymer transport system component
MLPFLAKSMPLPKKNLFRFVHCFRPNPSSYFEDVAEKAQDFALKTRCSGVKQIKTRRNKMQVPGIREVGWNAALWAFVGICLSPLLGQDDAKDAKGDSDQLIYIGQADGSGMQQLVDLKDYGIQGGPVWSADGTKVAFHAYRPSQGEKDTDAQIVVVNADGSDPKVLSDGAFPSFSPQHQRLTFTRYAPNPGVWVMSVEGPEKELVRLDAGYGAGRWSPDGKRIAYTTTRDNGINLYVFDLIEGDEYAIFEEGKGKCPYNSFFRNLSWSPDGTKIAFKGQRRGKQTLEVAIVDARGADHGLTVRYEAKTLYNVSWNHDGTRILFTQPTAGDTRVQLFTLNANDDSPPELLPRQDASRANINGVISPDGKRMLLASRKPAVELAADKGKKKK